MTKNNIEVPSTVCIDCSKNAFDITNIKDSALDKIKVGLIEEGKKKKYISESDLTDENICSFLKKLKFVIDNDKRPSEYVRSIMLPCIVYLNKRSRDCIL